MLDLFLGQQLSLAVVEVVDYKSYSLAGLVVKVEELTAQERQASQNKDSSALLVDDGPNEEVEAHCGQEAVFAKDRCFRSSAAIVLRDQKFGFSNDESSLQLRFPSFLKSSNASFQPEIYL